MNNPTEVIARSERRIAQVAALHAALVVLAPAALALAICAGLGGIASITWERWDYQLPEEAFAALRMLLLAIGVVGVGVAISRGRAAWRKASDLIAAAERIDQRVGSKQEIVTLATMTRGADGKATRSVSPSVLFPILWRRSLRYLAKFDPLAAFPLELAKPLKRSLWGILALIIALGFGVPALIAVKGSTYGGEARKLRQIARDLAGSDSSRDSIEFAQELRAAADVLENPKLPPEKKLQQLAAVMLKLEQKANQPSGGAQNAQNSSGKGNGGNGEGGKGQGKGAGGNGEGSGTGEGSGKEPGQVQIAEARKELSKAQARVEMESEKPDKSRTKPEQGKGEGKAPRPGNNPNLPGPNDQGREKERAENGASPQPEQGRGNQQTAQNRQPKESGQPGGDTHLGQFPEPARFQRFYKPGEHGPPIDIRDARYVLFRIPPATRTGEGGVTVTDKDRPEATTPYTNVPLPTSRLKAEPSEQQLIPPRYRDLLQ